MKPYETLGRLGRIRRMRELARAALRSYDLKDPKIMFLKQAGNTLFRVVEPAPAPSAGPDEIFAEGRYLLRVHNHGRRSLDGVALELQWLAAMRREAGLPVQEPVRTRDGDLLAIAEAAGGPGERKCSLLRWLKGRFVRKGIGPRHLRAQGRLMARLHTFAEEWMPPSGLAKRHYDWDGLFRKDDGTGIPASEAWAMLSPSSVRPFETVAGEIRRVMDGWGRRPGVYGLIHGDMGVDANVLFWRGEARAIDFDDSGFGYYMYDLAVALEHCLEDPGYPAFRGALLGGYREIRALPDEQADRLELFLAAFQVYWSLWAAAAAHLHPEYREGLRKRVERYASGVKRYLSAG
jgi:Ser/Thr protein kinase RdoA (MazF antagonist)